MRAWLSRHWLDVLLEVVAVVCWLSLLAHAGCSLRPTMRLPSRVAVSVAEDPALEAQCRKLDHAVIGLTAGSVAAGALGGGNGLAALFTGETSRWATGGVAVGTTVAGAILGYLSNAYSARYTQQCTASATGAP